jgi:hypothetical protein
MADIIIHVDAELEHALGVLTRDGVSRADAVRRALQEAAARQERAQALRRAVLRMPLGPPDGINLADDIANSR